MIRAKSVFIRKGCLLTTLAAIVLLAASAGTAAAQPPRVAFTPLRGSVNEGATAAADSEHTLLTVTVRAWGLPAGPAGQDRGGQPTARQQAIDALGDITIETDGIGLREAATLSPVYNTAAALDEDAVFAASDIFQLTVTPVQDDDSRNDEFTLRLRSTESIFTGSSSIPGVERSRRAAASEVYRRWSALVAVLALHDAQAGRCDESRRAVAAVMLNNVQLEPGVPDGRAVRGQPRWPGKFLLGMRGTSR